MFKAKAMKKNSTGSGKRQQKKKVIERLKNLGEDLLKTSEDFREKTRNIDERLFTGK